MNEPLTPALDRVTFQQVWRRVMPEDRPDCPFTLEAPAIPTVTSTPVPVASPPSAVSRMAPPPAPVKSCLGEASMGELPLLGELLRLTVEGQRSYQALARRSRRGGVFSSLAAAKAGQARRLSTADFLISGKEQEAQPPQLPRPLPGALAVRERYHAEQSLALRLEEAARATADPCLAELYRTLAGEDRSQAERLRSWLEEG